MATHPSVLAWRIPGTGEPGGLPSMESHRVGHDWSDLAAAAAAWHDKPLWSHSFWGLGVGNGLGRYFWCLVSQETVVKVSHGVVITDARLSQFLSSLMWLLWRDVYSSQCGALHKAAPLHGFHQSTWVKTKTIKTKQTNKKPRWNLQSYYSLILEAHPIPSASTLFFRSESWSPVHTQAEGIIQGCEYQETKITDSWCLSHSIMVILIRQFFRTLWEMNES